jgi:hypothetical protein
MLKEQIPALQQCSDKDVQELYSSFSEQYRSFSFKDSSWRSLNWMGLTEDVIIDFNGWLFYEDVE